MIFDLKVSKISSEFRLFKWFIYEIIQLALICTGWDNLWRIIQDSWYKRFFLPFGFTLIQINWRGITFWSYCRFFQSYLGTSEKNWEIMVTKWLSSGSCSYHRSPMSPFQNDVTVWHKTFAEKRDNAELGVLLRRWLNLTICYSTKFSQCNQFACKHSKLLRKINEFDPSKDDTSSEDDPKMNR